MVGAVAPDKVAFRTRTFLVGLLTNDNDKCVLSKLQVHLGLVFRV